MDQDEMDLIVGQTARRYRELKWEYAALRAKRVIFAEIFTKSCLAIQAAVDGGIEECDKCIDLLTRTPIPSYEEVRALLNGMRSVGEKIIQQGNLLKEMGFPPNDKE